jgi:hypothetical protein
MALSFEKLNTVLVRDPRTIVTNSRDYAILKSGSQTTWKQYTTTSVSSSSIQFSCPPPSGGVFVDRKQYLYLPVRLTFTGVPPNNATLLRPNQDAPRAYPISSAIDTLQATINNQSVSVNIADIVHALMHFNTDEKVMNLDYSTFPALQDQSQNYSDLLGAIRSPLQGYGDSNDYSVMGRGGFANYNIVSNPVGNGVASVTAIVDCAFCEPLFLSPFYWGRGNASAFFNVTTMDFNITFLGNAANRFWSHDPSGVSGTVITSSSAQFNNFTGTPFSFNTQGMGNVPLMFFQYITPQETQILSPQMSVTYPFFDLPRYPSDFPPIAPNGTAQLTSNNIQLSSIPRRLYVFVRNNNSTLYSNASYTDTFMQINNVSIQFQNKSGLLSSASMSQLYQMSVKNHCSMSWTQWSGGPVHVAGGFTKYGTIGSVLCIEFATDIGLDSLDAPGKLGQYMLQLQVNVTNVNQTESVNPTLYLVPVLEGTFTIEGLGRASTNIGVITSQEILDAQSRPFVNYKDVESVNGGDFLSGLRDFGNRLWNGLKQVHNFVKDNRLISQGLDAFPMTKPFAPIAKSLGYGHGGVLVGGEKMSRSSLRKRLR